MAIERADTEDGEAASLYDKLETSSRPLPTPNAWARMQQHCIGINGTFFNTHRMLAQYYSNAYFPRYLPKKPSPSRPICGSRHNIL